ncbi:NACHT domain-containing protein [Streptomyces aquilus]|uniref:NACHT domain-containing protein n=1 Tax=Streptomyces aquilus TaxID=2548456 RepID=UPI0036B1E2CC
MAVGGSAGRVALAGVVSALVAGTLVYTLSGDHGALGVSDRSGLVSMVATMIGLVVTVVVAAWSIPGRYEDEATAVARLAREVRSVGEPQWTHSLGGELTAIDVTFTFRPYAHARAAALPPTPAGQLGRVVEDYRAVRPRRLVITGEPGAGKTVLARKLVMQLNKARGEREPVAVLIALADWDTREALADWIVRHLERDFGLPRRSARKAVDAQLVLPVLDGLDEMDATDVEAADSRARRALEALARYQDGTDPAPLVLTCRTRRYDELEADGSHILDAARIEIEPVDSARAVRFLELRGAARRPALWEPVLQELRTAPGGVLASALSTPWRLALAATVYERAGDPGELVGAAASSVDAVAELLLGRFIGAVVDHVPRHPGRYTERTTHVRLHRLAVGLETDLVLHRLGDRLAATVRVVLIGGLVLMTAVQVAALWQWPLDVEVATINCLGLVLAVLFLFSALGSLQSGPTEESALSGIALPTLGSPLWRLGLRRFGRRKLRAAAVVLLVGTSLWWGLVGGPLDLWSVLFVAFTGWSALMVVVICVMVEFDSTALGPGGPVRAAWYLSVLVTGMIAGGVVIGGGPALVDVLFGACLGSVLFGVMSEWVGYLIYRLANPLLGPRLPTFLDWCVTAGLLRTSGIAYQFRHREFQEWLVRHPRPVH